MPGLHPDVAENRPAEASAGRSQCVHVAALLPSIAARNIGRSGDMEPNMGL